MQSKADASSTRRSSLTAGLGSPLGDQFIRYQPGLRREFLKTLLNPVERRLRRSDSNPVSLNLEQYGIAILQSQGPADIRRQGKTTTSNDLSSLRAHAKHSVSVPICLQYHCAPQEQEPSADEPCESKPDDEVGDVFPSVLGRLRRPDLAYFAASLMAPMMIADAEDVLIELGCLGYLGFVRMPTPQWQFHGVAACACGAIIRGDPAGSVKLFEWGQRDAAKIHSNMAEID